MPYNAELARLRKEKERESRSEDKIELDRRQACEGMQRKRESLSPDQREQHKLINRLSHAEHRENMTVDERERSRGRSTGSQRSSTTYKVRMHTHTTGPQLPTMCQSSTTYKAPLHTLLRFEVVLDVDHLDLETQGTSELQLMHISCRSIKSEHVFKRVSLHPRLRSPSMIS